MPNLTPGPYVIDCLNFDKAATREIGQGYDLRPPGAVIDALVLHSTNGRGASFAGESAWLRDSPTVSAHYLVGRGGQLARVLDPKYRAWHAGQSRYDEVLFWPGRAPSAYAGRVAWNTFSIGIELAHQVGTDYPLLQLEGLRWLINELRTNYPAIRKEGIVLHRWIAGPQVRAVDVKTDPSDQPDGWWRQWINSL